MKLANIRNFAIIAHIDHGKSTLADRIMEQTDTVSKRQLSDQLLDSMEVEQAHGVTVKSRSVRNFYQADNGQEYEYNLIDTPGHVDFSYEVSKSLAASDGAILLVDATQGVQAQTVANLRLALKHNLTIIPVINKIDNAAADVAATEAQIRALRPEFADVAILKISAKTGENVHQVLEAIYQKIPAPQGKPAAPLKALLFDSQYDSYQGIIADVRLIDGTLKNQQKLELMQGGSTFNAQAVGIFTPDMKPVKELNAGEVGYLVTGIKDVASVQVGDTLTAAENPTKNAIPHFKPAQSMVYAGFYPKGNTSYEALKQAISKLALNDSAFHYTPEQSEALDAGFRCGFLGIFHLQIIQERLRDEYHVEVLTTAPNATYHVYLKQPQPKQEYLTITNPAKFPDFSEIDYVTESYVKAVITTPNEYLGAVMKLCDQHFGEMVNLDNQQDLVTLTYKLPVSEIAYDFFNSLKSITHGFATLDTEFLDYELVDVVKIQIQINYAAVDALDIIVPRQKADLIAHKLVKKLKYTVPRRLYPMPVQAMVENKAIARVDVPPLRKNAAVNGEKRSISKKQQLLRRQSLNKRQAVKSDIKLPQSVFDAILNINEPD
ncbi:MULTISPECIES: translation elongation factor 4 [unclassified Lactobacillus]|uniref:translation elongation factor 4 n=1 Tax=unclassified Lactobacillus TaxID=2620435 RepID=UPI0018DD2F37|nr:MULTISPECIES: translation elongation factor 4 [unclassified Lactobacillus]MBH9989395.1 elongation factor 4 [Lactobacillus sp. M0392]MBI0024006.1 elongation factor 4 [Lactobacillus sp. W8171]MBI0044436.1 elongation factor 4 [Lactobacillus sp. M0393]